MSQSNREKRMERVVSRRDRTPVVCTHKVVFETVVSKSKAGVQHTHYKSVVIKK